MLNNIRRAPPIRWEQIKSGQRAKSADVLFLLNPHRLWGILYSMKKFELDDKEEKVLQTLAQHGAMSPSQVSAQTWMLPGETLTVLKTLSGEGLVLMRDDTTSPDGMLVAITSDARDFVITKKG